MNYDLKKILILAANPKGTNRLRLDEEVREIQKGLERSRRRDQFEIISLWAVRPDDLRRALLDYEPQIVHFSGHGAGEQGLILEDDMGQVHLASSRALAGLFKFFQEKVQCVVLNACYSEVQAEAISQYIPYLIGMNQGISDRAALAFSIGFYDALVAGRSYVDAYELGCNAIELKNIPEELTPQIIVKHSQSPPIKPKPPVPPIEPEPLPPLVPVSGSRSVQTLPSLEELYNQAYQRYKAGQWQDVLSTFERIKAIDPNYNDSRGLRSSAQQELRLAALYDRAYQLEHRRELQLALRQFVEINQLRKGYRDTEARIAKLQSTHPPASSQFNHLLVSLIVIWTLCWVLISAVAYSLLGIRGNSNPIVIMTFFGLVGGLVSNLVKQLVIVKSRALDLKQMGLWAGLCAGIWMLISIPLASPSDGSILVAPTIAAILSFMSNVFWQLFQPKSVK